MLAIVRYPATFVAQNSYSRPAFGSLRSRLLPAGSSTRSSGFSLGNVGRGVFCTTIQGAGMLERKILFTTVVLLCCTSSVNGEPGTGIIHEDVAGLTSTDANSQMNAARTAYIDVDLPTASEQLHKAAAALRQAAESASDGTRDALHKSAVDLQTLGQRVEMRASNRCMNSTERSPTPFTPWRTTSTNRPSVCGAIVNPCKPAVGYAQRPITWSARGGRRSPIDRRGS